LALPPGELAAQLTERVSLRAGEMLAIMLAARALIHQLTAARMVEALVAAALVVLAVTAAPP